MQHRNDYIHKITQASDILLLLNGYYILNILRISFLLSIFPIKRSPNRTERGFANKIVMYFGSCADSCFILLL